jgi:regulator of sigma E protease
MSGLIMAAQLILGLSILVILHEFGHFIAARAFGIKVEKFYLFFDAWGFKLFKFKKGETEYGIGWLPLGGYVKIAGMIDESMDKEAMKQPAQPWEFRSKPAWQRLIVMLAGVFMNLILGLIIYTFITYHYEKAYLPTDQLTNGVYAYESGREIGFKTGDKIAAVNGEKIERFKDVVTTNVILGATVTVERQGKSVDILIPDNFFKKFNKSVRDFFVDADNYVFTVDSVIAGKAASKAKIIKGDRFIKLDTLEITSYGLFRENIWKNKGKTLTAVIQRGKDTVSTTLAVDSTGLIGIVTQRPYKNKEYTFFSSIKYGVSDGFGILWANMRGLGRIFTGQVKATESLQGPIAIAQIYGGSWNWFKFWWTTGLLSLVLAFMNILPIPALDGGHVIFTTIEIITGKKVPDKILEKAQIVGMVLLLALMVFAVGNDLWKVFFK